MRQHPPVRREASPERYRQYWIHTNPLNGYVWIEKDGQHISSPATVVDARQQIDQLEGGSRP